MKNIFYSCLILAAVLLTACQPENYRTVYPAGNPQLSAQMLTESVLYGTDSVEFNVAISETETPLSQLHVKVLVGLTVVASDVVRTQGLRYTNTLKYAIPFGPYMPEGEEIKVYLTATNIEGTEANLVLSGCYGTRPAMETMFVMPPSITYTKIGKGQQMEYDEQKGVFYLYDLAWPKNIECLLAVTGTRFGRVDWDDPVFGSVNDAVALITQEQFETGLAQAIAIGDDRYQTLDTIIFDPVTFEITIGGKIAQPVTTLDVTTDLEENPSFISSTAVAKRYRGAKIYFDQDSEIEISGVQNIETAYNLDYMEYVSDNTVRFLGEKGMYYVSYSDEYDYIIVEPLYDLTYPDVMYLCGVGMGQPAAAPSATSGWGFDSPEQNFVGRTIASGVYQFTVYMNNNAENPDHPGFGSVNFKFFHQHGWGGEESSLNYSQSGLNIVSSNEESNVGNWWSTSDPLFEGIYRITLDTNEHSTTYEKIR